MQFQWINLQWHILSIMSRQVRPQAPSQLLNWILATNSTDYVRMAILPLMSLSHSLDAGQTDANGSKDTNTSLAWGDIQNFNVEFFFWLKYAQDKSCFNKYIVTRNKMNLPCSIRTKWSICKCFNSHLKGNFVQNK